jgi:hypothetical protein
MLRISRIARMPGAVDMAVDVGHMNAKLGFTNVLAFGSHVFEQAFYGFLGV